MEEIRFDTIEQVNDYYGITTLHPLVTVIHLERMDYTVPVKAQIRYGLYAIWLKETKGCWWRTLWRRCSGQPVTGCSFSAVPTERTLRTVWK